MGSDGGAVGSVPCRAGGTPGADLDRGNMHRRGGGNISIWAFFDFASCVLLSFCLGSMSHIIVLSSAKYPILHTGLGEHRCHDAP